MQTGSIYFLKPAIIQTVAQTSMTGISPMKINSTILWFQGLKISAVITGYAMDKTIPALILPERVLILLIGTNDFFSP